MTSVPLNLGIRWPDPIFAKLLDVSRDGRYVAYTVPLRTFEFPQTYYSSDLPFRTTVVRVADGVPVFSLKHSNAAVAISSDGSLLAVGGGTQQQIRFYRILQD